MALLLVMALGWVWARASVVKTIETAGAYFQATPTPRGPVQLGAQPSSAEPSQDVQFSGPATFPESGFSQVMVVLTDPSAGETYAFARHVLRLPPSAADVMAQAQLRRIEAVQRALLARLAHLPVSATVISWTQWPVNGIVIEIDVMYLDQLRGLPGVRAVWPMRTGNLDDSPDNSPNESTFSGTSDGNGSGFPDGSSAPVLD